MVAHGSYVYEDLTARENLRFWETMRGGDPAPARVMAALAQVELDGVADERARTFSAGMKRRLALARVLLGQARVLLLDEPFTGLDWRGRKWVREFIQTFRATGGAAVVATHSFGGGLGVADRVGILMGGRLLVDRPADLSGAELHRLYESLTDGIEVEPRPTRGAPGSSSARTCSWSGARRSRRTCSCSSACSCCSSSSSRSGPIVGGWPRPCPACFGSASSWPAFSGWAGASSSSARTTAGRASASLRTTSRPSTSASWPGTAC